MFFFAAGPALRGGGSLLGLQPQLEGPGFAFQVNGRALVHFVGFNNPPPMRGRSLSLCKQDGSCRCVAILFVRFVCFIFFAFALGSIPQRRRKQSRLLWRDSFLDGG